MTSFSPSIIASTLALVFMIFGCDEHDHNHSDHSDHSDHNHGGAMEGSCDAPPAGQCLETPWTVSGENYELTLEQASPESAIKGENEWTFALKVLESSESFDMANSLVSEGMCQLTVTPWMPDHGHGSSVSESEWVADNQYKVAEIDLIMPGFWEIRVDVKCDSLEEQVIFPLWLEN